MRNLILLPAILLLALIGTACGSKSSKEKAENLSLEQSLDTVDVHQMIAWKGSQGMPLYEEEIDTVIAYFRQADEWTAAHIDNVQTKEQFDSLDALFVNTFPYMELYSAMMESMAPYITEHQMEQFRSIYMSMSSKVEKKAKSFGLDIMPEEELPAADSTNHQ